MLDPVLIGKKIRKYRERAGITQQELSARLFVSFQAVSAWERGLALPDLENTVKLADCLNVKLDTLLSVEREALYLAVDGGGTKTEFVLFDKDGTVRKRHVTRGSNPNDIGVDRSIAILTEGIDELVDGGSVAAIFAGIAGVTTGDNIQVIQKALADRYAVKVNVDTDAVNVLCMGKDVENSASVICGTGSCVFIRKNGVLKRLGGWGYLFDRAGSAYDVGNDGIRHALAVYDGLEEKTLLSESICEKVGGDLWKELSSIYNKGRSHIAAFAMTVVECAEKGDGVALKILEDNARRIAQLISLARAKHGATNEFVCSGGFFKNDIFKKILQEMSGAELLVPDTPPIYGACVELMRLSGMDRGEDFKKNFKESYR